MMHFRGFGADESKTAFVRARMLAAEVRDASERFDAYYGLFIGSLLRGALSLARETAESFLLDAETEGRMAEAGSRAATRAWRDSSRAISSAPRRISPRR
jgi:hypothetical protein